MFWLGICIGLVIGANLGLVVTAMLFVGKRCGPDTVLIELEGQ